MGRNAEPARRIGALARPAPRHWSGRRPSPFRSATARMCSIVPRPGCVSTRENVRPADWNSPSARCASAEVVAFDLTEEMLASARERCGRFADRFSTVAGDYAVDDIGSRYDLVLAGLTLHPRSLSLAAHELRGTERPQEPRGHAVSQTMVRLRPERTENQQVGTAAAPGDLDTGGLLRHTSIVKRWEQKATRGFPHDQAAPATPIPASARSSRTRARR